MDNPVEASMFDLERALAELSSALREHRMTDREIAIYHNGLAREWMMSAKMQHQADDDRRRAERIREWRRQVQPTSAKRVRS